MIIPQTIIVPTKSITVASLEPYNFRVCYQKCWRLSINEIQQGKDVNKKTAFPANQGLNYSCQCRALQARRDPTHWVHLSWVRAVFSFFLTDRARAYLASRLLLCTNTRTPHMYCMKYCYNNYIVNIIHRLCNRQLRNAYTHALAYRWQLTMQSIREKLERGELLKVPNASGKAAFWQSFVCIDICGHDCRWW